MRLKNLKTVPGLPVRGGRPRWNGGHIEERLSEVVDCVEVDLLHPHRKWVLWNVIDVIVCLLVLSRHCLWTSSGIPVVSQNLLVNGHP